MEKGKRTVLVTGASGFVGQHLSPALEREGWIVRPVVRQRSQAANEVVVNSIGPETDWRDALTGVDAVVHLAARVHQHNDRGSERLYRGVNTDGTLHLARRAIDAGVRHFIFVSTVLVYGRTSDGRPPFREGDVLTPVGLYGKSKAEAEVGLASLAQLDNEGFGRKGSPISTANACFRPVTDLRRLVVRPRKPDRLASIECCEGRRDRMATSVYAGRRASIGSVEYGCAPLVQAFTACLFAENRCSTNVTSRTPAIRKRNLKAAGPTLTDATASVARATLTANTWPITCATVNPLLVAR
jgi:hypothetical protein